MRNVDTIGQRLIIARKNLNLTVIDAAKAVGIAKSNLSRIENNKHEPAIATVMKLARFYGITTDWILFGDDSKGKPDENLVYVPDSKLRESFTLLMEMWREGNQDLRGWMTVQLQKTFPEIALKMKKNK